MPKLTPNVSDENDLKFRHEYKYAINYSDYLTLRSRLRLIAKPDPYAGDLGSYQIRSLYFENIYDTALREKIDGINNREKFRIRMYNNDTDFIRLEKKSKINGLCNKISTELTKEQTTKIIYGDYDWMLDTKDMLIIELYSKIRYKLLRPKVIVDYTREPYIYAAGNVRITFDYNVRTGLMSTELLNPDTPLITAGDPIFLLEVKYDEYIPQIMQDIIQLDNRRHQAFSKYGVSRIYD